MLEGKIHFLSTLLGSWLRHPPISDERLIGEKETDFDSWARRPHSNRTEEVAKMGSFYTFYIQDKETWALGSQLVKNLNGVRAWRREFKQWQGLLIHRLQGWSSLSPAIRLSFYFQTQGVHLSLARFISCFQGDRGEGQHVPLALAVSYVTLSQNSQHAIVAYFGMACPAPSSAYCKLIITINLATIHHHT